MGCCEWKRRGVSCRSVSSGLLIRSRFNCPGCLTNRLLARNRAAHLLGCGTVSGVEADEQLEGSSLGKGWGKATAITCQFPLAAKAFCLARKRFYAFDSLAESKLIQRGARNKEILLIGWIQVYFPKWIPRIGKYVYGNERERRPEIYVRRPERMYVFLASNRDVAFHKRNMKRAEDLTRKKRTILWKF